jgi:hypothetical protein
MGKAGFEARGDQEQRFALDRADEFGFVLGLAGDAETAIADRVAVNEAGGKILFEHQTDHGAGGGAGAGGEGLGFVGGEHKSIYTRERGL